MDTPWKSRRSHVVMALYIFQTLTGESKTNMLMGLRRIQRCEPSYT